MLLPGPTRITQATSGAPSSWAPTRNPVDLPTEVVPATIDDNTYSGLGTTMLGTDGRYVIVYTKRPHNIGVGNYGKLVSRFSRDEGKTWSGETVIEDNSGALIDIRDCSGGTARNGRMTIFYALYNPANLVDNGGIGYAVSLKYRYSDDNGVTWSSAITYYTGTGTDWSFAAIGQLSEIGQGKLMHVWWHWITSNGQLSGVTAYVKAIFSTDSGATWGGQVTVGSSASEQLTESCHAYLGGGYDVIMSRIDNGTKYRQYQTTDNGATWSDKGLWSGDSWTTPAPPTLITYEDPTLGTRRVAMYYANRDAQKIRVTTAKAIDIINNNITAWAAYTDLVTTSSVDSAYQTVIHPFGDPRGFGWFYDNPGDDTANIVFFLYTASVAGIPTSGIGSTLDYVQRTTDLTVTATSSGTAQTWITGSSISYDGVTNIEIICNCPIGQFTNGYLVIEVFEDGTSIGRIAEISGSGTAEGGPMRSALPRTPTAGSHTYVFKAWGGGSAMTLYSAAGTFVPSYLRIVTV